MLLPWPSLVQILLLEQRKSRGLSHILWIEIAEQHEGDETQLSGKVQTSDSEPNVEHLFSLASYVTMTRL